MFYQAEYVKVSQVQVLLEVCSGHIMGYVKEAMESETHVWAAAPGSNPGQSEHFPGGEKQ
eukprot:11344548-Ditylum_brightwellii.AAC.1